VTPLVAITLDQALESVIQLGIGGAALLVIYKLLTPVVAALVRAMDAVVTTQRDIAQAMVGVAGVIAELRGDLHKHFQEDRETGAEILRRIPQRGQHG
jgi:hypothetical protein